MRAEGLRQRGRGLLLACAVLTTGCASQPPAPGRGAHLRYTPPEAAAPGVVEPPHAQGSSRPSAPEPEQPQRLHRRRALLHTVTRAAWPRGAGGAEHSRRDTPCRAGRRRRGEGYPECPGRHARAAGEPSTGSGQPGLELVLCWGGVYTVVAPVALYRLGEALGRVSESLIPR